MPVSSPSQALLEPVLAKTEALAIASAQLLQQRTAGAYLSDVIAATEAVAATIGRTDRPFTGQTPRDLKPIVDRVDLETPLGTLSEALQELESVYFRDAVYFHTPRYAAHLNCPVVIPALAGEAVLSAVNSSMDTWDQSAGATLIERKLIEWTAQRLGLGGDADGVFTSGGSQSNLQGLLMARNHAAAGVRENHAAGMPGFEGKAPRLPLILDRFRIFAAETAHFSVQKSASMLGLDYDAVISVPVDERMRMEPDALRTALRHCVSEGLTPMAIVGTAGSTDFGAIDPLTELAALAREYDAWFHVDAAYGGGLVTSLKYRHLLEGIELADSVTVDYHKTFFQPVSASAVLVRERSSLSYVTYYADYLNPASAAIAEIPNQVDKSIQTTRRFDALKLWLTLRVMGADAVGLLIDQVIDLAADVHDVLAADPEFEIISTPSISTVVFRYLPLPDPQFAGPQPEPGDKHWSNSAVDLLNRQIRSALFASGEAVVAGTVFNGVAYLKFTLLNPEARVEDISGIIELLRSHGRELVAAQKQTIRIRKEA